MINNHFVSINNHKTFYKTVGKKKYQPMVILHGMRGDHSALLPLACEIAKHKYWVILPDLPGHGKTQQITDHTLKAYSKWLLDFTNKLGLKNVVCVGHSYGANIAVLVGSEKTSSIEKVILFSPYLYQRSLPNLFNKYCYLIGKKLPKSISDWILYSRMISWLTIKKFACTKDPVILDWLYNNGHKAAQLVSRKVVIDIIEDLKNFKLADHIARLRVEGLVVTCGRDNFSDNKTLIHFTKTYSNLVHTHIEELGHLAPVEMPIQLVERIKKYL